MAKAIADSARAARYQDALSHTLATSDPTTVVRASPPGRSDAIEVKRVVETPEQFYGSDPELTLLGVDELAENPGARVPR